MSPEEALEILGARAGASPAELKAAYRRKALELHPDRHLSARDKALHEERFRKLGEAYELLKRAPVPAAKPAEPEPAGPDVKAPRSRWREHLDRVPEDLPLLDKLGLRFSWDLEPILLWGFVMPMAVVVLLLVARFFASQINP